MGKPFKILSFDGGGIRGMLSATLFSRLQELCPDTLINADLLSGTSIGALIALGLAVGHAPDELCNLFVERSPEIFKKNLLSFGGLCGSRYDEDGLVRVVTDLFGGRRMRDLPKQVVIPSFDLKSEGEADPSWKFRLFTRDDSDYVADVAIRSASAPTFFPSYQGFSDGGLMANNPALVATCVAMAQGSHPDDIRLLSLGTGSDVEYLDGQTLDWGGLKWAGPAINAMLAGQSQVSTWVCQNLLGERFHRLNPLLPKPIALDAVDHLAELERVARQTDLLATVEFLDRNWGNTCDTAASIMT